MLDQISPDIHNDSLFAARRASFVWTTKERAVYRVFAGAKSTAFPGDLAQILVVNMKSVWIVSAKRTPQGRFLGALAKRSAVELGVIAGRAALAGVDPALMDSVIVGNVLGAGLGMNAARQIGLGAGLPVSAPAFTVNMMRASGLQAVLLAVQAIQSGSARMVLCGGAESMSNAPYLLDRVRAGYKLGHGAVIDSVLRDGLTDAFSGEHMGLAAERLAKRGRISREAQDSFAARSQQRYAAAQAAGRFRDEIVPVDNLEQDEPPRPGTTPQTLAALKPVFNANGRVTAGNASGLNDGAAMLLVCDEERGRECGLAPSCKRPGRRCSEWCRVWSESGASATACGAWIGARSRCSVRPVNVPTPMTCAG
jgi:acetyl-CoA C-acetyltransferase